MPETIYYDGHCGLCHGFVKFVLKRDPAGQFQFSPLDQLAAAERLGLPDSVVVRTAAQGLLVKSAAALYVLERLGGIWKVLAVCARIVPAFIRNWFYDGVARIRYRVFGKRADVCPLVPPELRKRFAHRTVV